MAYPRLSRDSGPNGRALDKILRQGFDSVLLYYYHPAWLGGWWVVGVGLSTTVNLGALKFYTIIRHQTARGHSRGSNYGIASNCRNFAPSEQSASPSLKARSLIR